MGLLVFDKFLDILKIQIGGILIFGVLGFKSRGCGVEGGFFSDGVGEVVGGGEGLFLVAEGVEVLEVVDGVFVVD